MDERLTRKEENLRAARLRKKMQKVPLPPGLTPEIAPSPPLRLPRFVSTGVHLDGASFDGSLINTKLGITLTNRISLRGEPFVELTTSGTEAPLARWPMFAVIGGQNGPGHLETEKLSLDARGGQGWLNLKFFAQVIVRSNSGAAKGIWNKLTSIFRKSESIPDSASTLVSEVEILCEGKGRDSARFSARAALSDWKIGNIAS